MQTPTAADVRLWSQVTAADWIAAGFGLPPDPEATDPLGLIVAMATAYVRKVTGRDLSLIEDGSDDAVLMDQAIRMRTEQLVYLQTRKQVQSAADATYVTSFSVPGYSESRAVRPNQPTSGVRPAVNPWALLDDLLWLLMTPEMADYWMGVLTGQAAPAFAMEEVAWGRSGIDEVPGSWPTMWPGWGAL